MKKNVYRFSDIDVNEVAKRLKRLRLSKNFSSEQLSKILGISKSQISNLEHGKSLISTETLFVYSKYFNISMEYILGISNVTNSKFYEIGERTGLTDEVIAEFVKKGANSYLIDLFNNIFKLGYGWELLKCMYAYFYSKNMIFKKELIKEKSSKEPKEAIDIAKKYLKEEPSLLEEIYKAKLYSLLFDIKKDLIDDKQTK